MTEYLGNVLYILVLSIVLIFVLGPYIYYLAKLIYKYSLSEKNLSQRYGVGSWCIITGASRGQGRQMALKMAAREFNLILIGSLRTKQVIHEINAKCLQHK